MRSFIFSLATFCITSLLFLYYYEVKKPVDKEVVFDIRHQWMEFIQANIYASFTKYHCHQCRKMIVLFDQRFRRETPPSIFNEWISQLYDRLDTRYRNICTEDDRLSSITSADALNII